MDVIILAAGLGTRVTKYTHNILPKYLINIDNNTGLYHIIEYWNKYSENIYLVIHSRYNQITQFYLKNVMEEKAKNVVLINYDTNDGTAYTLSELIHNSPKMKLIYDNLLITWCDIFPTEPISFKTIKKECTSDIIIFTHGDKCRYLLDDKKNITNVNDGGNIIGIYYFQNFQKSKFILDKSKAYGQDIVIFLKMLGTVSEYNLKKIVDYGDEEKINNIFNNRSSSSNPNTFKCRYFNDIRVVEEDKIFKSGIDNKGKELINIERKWYEYISTTINNERFNKYIPKIHKIYDYGILMEYKKNYIPLFIYLKGLEPSYQSPPKYVESIINIAKNNSLAFYQNPKPKPKPSPTQILENILLEIQHLHNIKKVKENKYTFLKNIKTEILDKIITRKNKINDVLTYFGEIEYVNNIKIDTLDNILIKCKKIIIEYYKSRDDFEHSIILGDCQFSNILINPANPSEFVFIDPRGYFGDSKIFGPKEYDYAKILYAISGYDQFNDQNDYVIKNIDLVTKSIIIAINKISLFEKSVLNKYFNKVHKAFMVIIWLSLAEYNKNHIWKCLSSYYYGLYLGTIL